MQSHSSPHTIYGRCFADFNSDTIIRPNYWFGERPDSRADKGVALTCLEDHQEAYALAVPILGRPKSGLNGETFITVNFVIMPDTLYKEPISPQFKRCFDHRHPVSPSSALSSNDPQQMPLFY
jgi:hypothetical protein